MGQSSDQIRDEIEQRRADAAEKIDQLQGQVQGTADQMRTQVQESAEQVKETAEQVMEGARATVDETVQTIKESVDLKQHIEERPLVALGAALLGGFLLGGMTSGGGGSHHQSSPPYAQSSGVAAGSGMLGVGLRSAIQKSGLEETISNAGAAMMGNVTDQLKSILDRNFPGMADKIQTAQSEPGTFADKAKAAQSPTT